MRRWALWLTAAALACCQAAPMRLAVGDVQLAPTGADVTLERAGGAVRLTFTKPEPARRLIAVQAAPPGDLSAMHSLTVRGSVTLAEGLTARLALLVFERDGGVWIRVGAESVAAVTGPTELRLPLGGLRQAAFSDDANRQLDWPAVERLWLGLVIDGAGAGTFELQSAVFSPEPYRPTQPLAVPGPWTAGQDPAVQSTLTAGEAPGGIATMRYEFKLPGGRHMYAIPGAAAPGGDLEGYTHLRFTYRAALPEGIAGLLVMCSESGGAQYYADPAPPPSAEWTTIELPLAQFKLGGWTKDENGRLDLSQIRNVHIGLHGTATGQGGSGFVEAHSVAFVAK